MDDLKIDLELKEKLLNELKNLIIDISKFDKSLNIDMKSLSNIFVKLSQIDNNELFTKNYNEVLKIILMLVENIEKLSGFIARDNIKLDENISNLLLEKDLLQLESSLNNLNF